MLKKDPVTMTMDEIKFWDSVYVAMLDKGHDVYAAATGADQAVLLRRERWGQTEGIYR